MSQRVIQTRFDYGLSAHGVARAELIAYEELPFDRSGPRPAIVPTRGVIEPDRHFGPVAFKRAGRTLSPQLRHHLDIVVAAFAPEAPRLLARFMTGVERSLEAPLVNGGSLSLFGTYLDHDASDFSTRRASLRFAAMTVGDAFDIVFFDASDHGAPIGQTDLRPGSRDPERIFWVTDRLDLVRDDLASCDGLRSLLAVTRSRPLRRAG